MDKGQPLSIVLHFEFTPYDARFDRGWEPDDVTREVRDFANRLIRNTSDLELRDLEVLPFSYGWSRPRDAVADRLANAAEAYGRMFPEDEAVSAEFWAALTAYRERAALR